MIRIDPYLLQLRPLINVFEAACRVRAQISECRSLKDGPFQPLQSAFDAGLRAVKLAAEVGMNALAAELLEQQGLRRNLLKTAEYVLLVALNDLARDDAVEAGVELRGRLPEIGRNAVELSVLRALRQIVETA